MKRIGLTLGKFAPFHKGHQHLVETALAEMDELMVVIYNASDVTDIPLHVRAGWIRALYPQVTVIEAPDGPQCVGDTPKIRALHEEYLIQGLNISGIHCFYSGEFYGEHISKALGATNRQVDPGRTTFPVSGTLIRENPYRFRAYIDPLVYRDLITNVVFLGAPCTGKTTMAETLAKRFNTTWMPEYGREYWERYQVNRRLSKEQHVDIAKTHLQLERKKRMKADRFLFTDTNAITTYMFSLYYHGSAEKALETLADKAANRYDITFLCDTDIPYKNTWDRSGDMQRIIFQKKIIDDLNRRGIPYFLLRGTVEERISYVEHILNGFKFKGNIVNP